MIYLRDVAEWIQLLECTEWSPAIGYRHTETKSVEIWKNKLTIEIVYEGKNYIYCELWCDLGCDMTNNSQKVICSKTV